MDRCDECGFVYDESEAGAAAPAIVDGAAEIAALITSAPDVRRRRDPQIWSPLEYGCHMRDVLLVQRERVLEARRTEDPVFTPMGRNERVHHDGYSQQAPGDVARQLDDAAAMFANVLSRMTADEWGRKVGYNHPRTMERSLRWVAVHTVHEVRHHLMDVRRQLDD